MGKPTNITVIGPGVMGEAIIAGMLRKDITLPEHIRASGPLADQVEALQSRYQIQPYADNTQAVQGADLVILAVKPQKVSKVMAELCSCIPENALVLSIIAGATLQMLSEGLKHKSIVRAMPNTPAQIGEGITVWIASPSVNPSQLELARKVLEALGAEVNVEEEAQLDMATALSGTGPAYVFLFMEALVDAGVHMGFSRRIAEILVTQTILGSVSFYKKNGIHLAQLRNQVTSPGGTSAAAIYYLEKAGFRTAISRAIWAAYERSQELGKGLNIHPPDPKND